MNEGRWAIRFKQGKAVFYEVQWSTPKTKQETLDNYLRGNISSRRGLLAEMNEMMNDYQQELDQYPMLQQLAKELAAS